MRRRTLLSASFGIGALMTMTLPRLRAAALPALHTGSDLAFGTTVTISVMHEDASTAQAAIAAAMREVRNVDALMSLHRADSQVFQLNLHGTLDAPDPHLLRVLQFSQWLSELTAGAFDITVQPLWELYSAASARGGLPPAQAVATTRKLAGWRHVSVNRQRLRLDRPGMAVTLNGVAQGYAVDLAFAALQSRGIRHALLDTGEFGTIGSKDRTGHQPWLVGIGDPRHADLIASTVRMDGRRIATSGDYATFFTPDFKHHHIFDPASGDSPPALASVTVAAPTGLMADGLSTAFMVMGVERALAMAARLPQVDALLIGKDGAQYQTAGFPALPLQT